MGKIVLDYRIRDPSAREGIDFRKRYRVPYPIYCKLVVISEDSTLFNCASTDSWGRRGVPTELKILGVLRILGRGWCIDDVCESSGIMLLS